MTTDFSTNLSQLGVRELFTLLEKSITTLVERNEILEQNARTDSLTGLPNRRAMNEAVVRMFADAEREGHGMGVVVLDLDRFKKVNDTYGHHAGDTVLKAVSSAVTGAVRENDVVGRMGGEELAVLLKVDNLQDLASVGEKIRLAVQALNVSVTDNSGMAHTVNPTVSGAVNLIIQKPEGDLANLPEYKAADGMLYGAKDPTEINPDSNMQGRNVIMTVPDAILVFADRKPAMRQPTSLNL